MSKDLHKERADLEAILQHYESGGFTHFIEDERGELKRETTEERIASVKRRIAALDEKIARGDDA